MLLAADNLCITMLCFMLVGFQVSCIADLT
jgi:hypothetical protein